MFIDLSVRRFRAADLAAILAIERASFGRDAYDRNLFADLARTCGGLFLVACRGTRVIAYSVACVRLNRAELFSIAVDPKHRQRGAASELIVATLRRLRRRRVTRFALMVKVTNRAALAFYTKHGFRKVRRVRRYYEDGSDGWVFVRVL
jgi:[ribosomal protein S18]-alanine N-acetyltransferase